MTFFFFCEIQRYICEVHNRESLKYKDVKLVLISRDGFHISETLEENSLRKGTLTSASANTVFGKMTNLNTKRTGVLFHLFFVPNWDLEVKLYYIKS